MGDDEPDGEDGAAVCLRRVEHPSAAPAEFAHGMRVDKAAVEAHWEDHSPDEIPSTQRARHYAGGAAGRAAAVYPGTRRSPFRVTKIRLPPTISRSAPRHTGDWEYLRARRSKTWTTHRGEARNARQTVAAAGIRQPGRPTSARLPLKRDADRVRLAPRSQRSPDLSLSASEVVKHGLGDSSAVLAGPRLPCALHFWPNHPLHRTRS